MLATLLGAWSRPSGRAADRPDRMAAWTCPDPHSSLAARASRFSRPSSWPVRVGLGVLTCAVRAGTLDFAAALAASRDDLAVSACRARLWHWLALPDRRRCLAVWRSRPSGTGAWSRRSAARPWSNWCTMRLTLATLRVCSPTRLTVLDWASGGPSPVSAWRSPSRPRSRGCNRAVRLGLVRFVQTDQLDAVGSARLIP